MKSVAKGIVLLVSLVMVVYLASYIILPKAWITPKLKATFQRRSPAQKSSTDPGNRLSNQIPMAKWIMSGATARVFTGDKTRKFSRSAVKFKSFAIDKSTQNKVRDDEKLEPWCGKWGVVTTIFDVSEAVRRQVCNILWGVL